MTLRDKLIEAVKREYYMEKRRASLAEDVADAVLKVLGK